MAIESKYKSKKRKEVEGMNDRKLAEETLLELKIQNSLLRGEGSLSKKMNNKMIIMFFGLIALVIIQFIMLFKV